MIYPETPCLHQCRAERPQLNPGWIVRMIRLLRGTRRRDRAVHWPDTFTFSTPAEGDAYDFTVIVHFTWCVTGRDHGERLVLRTEDHYTRLLEHVMAKVRSVSRRYPPYRAADAEHAVHRALSDTFATMRFHHPDGEVRAITPRTMVEQAKPVLEAAQEAWQQRQRLENDHELAAVIAKRLGTRRELWQEFLRAGEKEWLTPYAVALAQDSSRAAEIVRTMFEDRRSQAHEMSDEIVQQVEEYGEADAFELMIHRDTVLSRLMELLQIPQAVPSPRPPFGDDSVGR